MKCDAVVLAAGKGSRLWPFTETQAKPAIKILDRPLVHYYHLADEVFEYLHDLSPSPRGEYEITDVLPKLGLRAITVRGDQWLDVGRPWDLLSAARILISRMSERRDGDIGPRATLKGKVIVSEGAEIRNGAYIEGPVFIGSGATVGPNAYVRPYSVI